MGENWCVVSVTGATRPMSRLPFASAHAVPWRMALSDEALFTLGAQEALSPETAVAFGSVMTKGRA